MIKTQIKCENGIHARPASQIVAIASGAGGDVFLTKNGKAYNAKSIMQILSMGLVMGDQIEIEAHCVDSHQIEEKLCALIDSIEV